MFEVSMIKQVKIDMAFGIQKNIKSYKLLTIMFHNFKFAGSDLSLCKSECLKYFTLKGTLTGDNVE